MEEKYLNLGCGQDKMKMAVNVDINPNVGADIVHDLNMMPWPLTDSEFDQITAQDIVEHVSKPLDFVEECGRVLKTGGLLNLRTPSFQSENSWIDPTHIHHLHPNSFDYFDERTELGSKYSYYTKMKFHILRKDISHDGNISWIMEKM
jgi:ubiquinone/menaquinone biosynthesis C-methylase UbiE